MLDPEPGVVSELYAAPRSATSLACSGTLLRGDLASEDLAPEQVGPFPHRVNLVLRQDALGLEFVDQLEEQRKGFDATTDQLGEIRRPSTTVVSNGHAWQAR